MTPLAVTTPHRTAPLSERLEQRARRIVANNKEERPRDSVDRAVAQEIGFILEGLERARDLFKLQRLSLLRVECSIDTELIQMEQRTPRYSPYRFPEREKLRRSLFAIETERRRLAADHLDRTRSLDERLLGALSKHDVLALN